MLILITASLCSHDLVGPTPSSGSSTPVIQTANLDTPASSSVTTTTNVNQNVLPTTTTSSSDDTGDHMITKNVNVDASSDRKGITRQGAVAVDTATSRKGPPPVPTRASSTTLTDEQQRQQQLLLQQQQQRQQGAVVSGPPDGSRDNSTVTKIPPKVAKKPKANKKSTQPQASTGAIYITVNT